MDVSPAGVEPAVLGRLGRRLAHLVSRLARLLERPPKLVRVGLGQVGGLWWSLPPQIGDQPGDADRTEEPCQPGAHDVMLQCRELPATPRAAHPGGAPEGGAD